MHDELDKYLITLWKYVVCYKIACNDRAQIYVRTDTDK